VVAGIAQQFPAPAFADVMRELVSIITPSFNRESLVSETLESILGQSYPNWENIIVDDGSTDRTKEIVSRFVARDVRFKLFDRQGSPKGACTCRNEGVARSAGSYVMFLDTDDIIEPFCLEQRVAAMEANPELDFAIFPGLMFEKVPNDLGLWWNIDKAEDELTRQFKQDAICQGTGVLWRKKSFERIGMWDASLMLWQDVDLFFRAYIQGYRYKKFFDFPPDLHNRVSQDSLSRKNFLAPAKTLSRCKVIRRAVDLLEANGLSHRRSEARYMAAEVVSGASRSGQARIAYEMIGWGTRRRVLNLCDSALLTLLATLRLLRLDRGTGKGLLARLESRYHVEATVGIVKLIPTEHSANKDSWAVVIH
jgi:glycosyltransferase involved in cell wall biosynthesis